MGIKLAAASGGSIELVPTNTASNFTVTVPAVTATVLTDSAGILNIGSGQIYKDASGNLLVGTTSGVPNGGFNIQPNGFGTGQSVLDIGHINGTPSTQAFERYIYNNTIVGSITQNGTTGVLYNLSSDYRLKNNPQALTGAKDFVMALQPKKWQWWDGSGEGVGFIAHEFMEVAKYSGSGTKDAVETVQIKDEQGNVTGTEQRPVMQSIQPSSSEVMANLVSFIQEQQALIVQLQADVAALKGAQA